jgi:L-alanine-DL-glutamate epimerase-like enolase superfamily enzyme
MNRRDWFKTFGAASAPPLVAQRQGNAVETEIVRLNLRHTWTTTMSSSEFRETLHLRFRSQGTTGRGEGAPIVRYKESAQTARKAVESVAEYLKTADPWKFSKVLGEVFRRIGGEWAAKAAIDIALMDWAGQKLGVPLYRYFGLDARDAPVTTFSIGMDKPDVVRRKILEAEQFPVLKIKVGLDSDEEMLASVRGVTKKPLRVDANEGWKSREEAVRKINWLESQGVEFIEQPMPASMIGDIRWVRSKVHIPIIADEACLHPRDIPELATAYDGVNVKIDKCGGMLEAFRMIQVARSLGLKVMLGCMVSSSVAVTAAAHLSPLADYADLDGNLLVSNDPYTGVLVERGKLVLPNRPGLGLLPAKGGG